ncbi:MAG: hypothetical protein ABIO17_12260 [Pseudoxanthomonas sp.]
MAKRPTRSQVIGAGIVEAVLQARLTWNQYAAGVVQHDHDLTAMEDRIVEFHVASTADNFDSCTRLNTQTIKRILLGEIRMCVDIEESLIAALPDAQRDRLLGQLLGRDGLLLARKPAAQGDYAGQMATPCDLMRSTAHAVEKIMPMLADGSGIGPEDAPLFSDAMHGINQVMGACITINAQIADAMGMVPKSGVLKVVK